MGLYKYLKETFQKEYKERSPLYRKRLIEWRRAGVVERIDKPTNLARAREIGYKDKQGFAVARAKVRRGRRKRPTPDLGRKPSKAGRFFSPKKSLQRIAEERVATRYPNMEVLNSYWVGADGKYKYYEIIMVDPNHPEIKNDASLNWVARQKGRAFRGLTAAGKKSRGLRHKGKMGKN